MLSNIGLFFLCFSFACSLASLVYLVSGRATLRVSKSLSWLIFVAVTISGGLLAISFYSNDFSNAYVAGHSNSMLPWHFRLAAIWGGHEGSMLFWVWIVALWGALISLSKTSHHQYLKQTLLVLSVIAGVLSLFVLVYSNPFALADHVASEGRDLNPMLQDVALILHPPLLYVGYVGFSAPFAAASVAVWNGSIEQAWFQVIRTWTMVSWVFLTAGIGLGAWWAYYELGWGGWWFWDPVENASLMPWLVATALIHTLLLSKKSVTFPLTALALSFVCFSLSLLGTFIVRSGVLTSVHAFAVDPDKGITLIGLSVLVLLVGLVPLILKAPQFMRSHQFKLNGKPLYLVVSVAMLLIANCVVMLGTFYPMLFQVFGLGSISVGAPYFNTLFSLIVVLGMLALSVQALIGYSRVKQLSMGLLALICGLLVTELGLKLNWDSSALLATVAVACGLLQLNQFVVRRNLVSTLAHLAILCLIVGAVSYGDKSYQQNRKLSVGELVELQDYRLHFIDKQWLIGPNYSALEATFTVQPLDNPDQNYQLKPQKRHYPVRVMNMNEPAIRSVWHGDLYLSFGEKLSDGSYIVKFQYKSGMSLIWLSVLLLLIAVSLRIINTFQLGASHRHDRSKIDTAVVN